ncbi:hypothetical protein [Bradyrhizobium sp. CB3481]|uniref:hypothetical protein n=1 Tax=Bradyrhizobium sp. CB3481 TaxID=3039158 RepID=UPI0024B23278|nr:hypothetical protein [Bradyrhizobium sp. CB3481]WFU15363.1 hypothetical protein QA643_30945 [Bradyrhizobium sp. CB3481]
MNPEKTLGPGSRSENELPDQPALPGRIRIRMSALGAIRCPNLAGREGVIIGIGHYRSTFRIMFDGFKSATSLHSTYIETIDEE